MIVWDNVPWGFVTNASAALGKYGNAAGPEGGAALELYEQFAINVTSAMAERYGRARVAGWQFRIGSEPNKPDHWEDTSAACVLARARPPRPVATAVRAVTPPRARIVVATTTRCDPDARRASCRRSSHLSFPFLSSFLFARYVRLYTAVDRAVREVLSDQTWVGPGNFARGGDAFVDYVAEHLSVDRTAYIDNAGDDKNIGDDTTEGDDVVLGDDDKPSADDETHGVHRQLDASGGRSVWDDNYPFEWAARTPKVLGMTYYATWEKEYTMSSFYRDAAWLNDLRGIVRGVVDDAAENDENSVTDLPALHFMEVRARPSAMRRHVETVGIRHTASRRASTRMARRRDRAAARRRVSR